MVYYVLKSALLLTLLYGGFSVFLSRETFHRFNRVVLVVIMLVSMALPAVHITTERPTPVTLEQYWEPMLQDTETQAPSPASVAPEQTADGQVDAKPSLAPFLHRVKSLRAPSLSPKSRSCSWST